MRVTFWIVLGTLMILWMGCGAEVASSDADAGPGGSGTGGSGTTNVAGAGSEAGGSAGGSTECESISKFPAACNECLQSNCHQACLDMQNHPEAKAHQACVEDCSDDSCTSACNTAFPAFIEALEAFLACMDLRCCETCTCCVCDPCSISTRDEGCDACIYENCLDSCVSLDTLPGLPAYSDCRNACTDDACLLECDAAHPELVAAIDELTECALSACATTCGDVLSP
jgi:hypothetical protein